MKKVFLLLCASALSTGAFAQVSITPTTLTYVQNFNSLDSATTSTSGGLMLPLGWHISEVYTGTSASTADSIYRSGTGSANNGDTYSFGPAGSSDRALGSLASNSLYSMFGVDFRNNTNSRITNASISLKMEQWRVGDTSSRQDTTWFQYSTTATSIGDTNSAAWTEVPALMLNSVVTASTSTTGNALDGNAAANSRTVMASVPMNLAPGAKVLFRWKDKNIVGSDDGLAIDDMSVTFATAQGVNNVSTANLPLTIMGNGVDNNMNLRFTAPSSEAYTVTVADLSGREISRIEGKAATGQTLNLSVTSASLQAGMYLVRVQQGSFAGVAKMVIR